MFELVGFPPEKDQVQAVGLFVDISWKLTVKGAFPLVISAVKFAKGVTKYSTTTIKFSCEIVLLPSALLAVKTTL